MNCNSAFHVLGQIRSCFYDHTPVVLHAFRSWTESESMQNVVFLTRQCENAVNNYDQVLIYGYQIQKLTF